MRKYRLMVSEKNIICKFEKMSIPYIFKSGIYRTYMQYFEIVIFDVCYSLKQGEYLDLKIYETLCNQPSIDFNKLDEHSSNFVECYLKVLDITKKYHSLYI